jgi:hypothetical protein
MLIEAKITLNALFLFFYVHTPFLCLCLCLCLKLSLLSDPGMMHNLRLRKREQYYWYYYHGAKDHIYPTYYAKCMLYNIYIFYNIVM